MLQLTNFQSIKLQNNRILLNYTTIKTIWKFGCSTVELKQRNMWDKLTCIKSQAFNPSQT